MENIHERTEDAPTKKITVPVTIPVRIRIGMIWFILISL